MKLDVWGAAIQGKRARQEDCFLYLVEEDRSLMVVCDGMGGHEGGDRASQTVGEAFVAAFSEAGHRQADDIAALLSEALEASHQAIIRAVGDAVGPADMGTTLVAAFSNAADLYWLSVGDSHIYLYRDGKLSKLNADHSMAGVLDQLVATGRLTPDEARSDPNRNALRSSVSADHIPLVDAGAKASFLKRGDRLLLASDGLDTLPISRVADIIHQYRRKPPSLVVDKLLQEVENAGSPHQDNTTLLMAALRGTSWMLGME